MVSYANCQECIKYISIIELEQANQCKNWSQHTLYGLYARKRDLMTKYVGSIIWRTSYWKLFIYIYDDQGRNLVPRVTLFKIMATGFPLCFNVNGTSFNESRDNNTGKWNKWQDVQIPCITSVNDQRQCLSDYQGPVKIQTRELIHWPLLVMGVFFSGSATWRVPRYAQTLKAMGNRSAGTLPESINIPCIHYTISIWKKKKYAKKLNAFLCQPALVPSKCKRKNVLHFLIF